MQNEKFCKSKTIFRFRLNYEVIMFSIKNKSFVLGFLLIFVLAVQGLS